MDITTFSTFRQNMKAYFERVLNHNTPLFITRPKGRDVVLMSRSEYVSIMETFHLLKSPANAQRLLQSIEEDKAGKGTQQPLAE